MLGSDNINSQGEYGCEGFFGIGGRGQQIAGVEPVQPHFEDVFLATVSAAANEAQEIKKEAADGGDQSK